MLARRRPRTTLLLLVLLLLFGCLGGVNLWAYWQLSAATSAWRDDRLDDARVHLQRCLQIWPNSVRAHFLGVHIERRAEKFSAAEIHLNECKRLIGMTDQLQLEWFMHRALNGEFPRLEPYLLDRLQQKDPLTPLILETLAQAYAKELRYGNAHAVLDVWLKSDPDNIRALELRSWVRERMENKDGFYEDSRRILELSPQHWQVRLRLAEYLLIDFNPKEAAQQLEALGPEKQKLPEVRLVTVRLQILQGNMEEARRNLDELIAEKPVVAVLSLRGKVEQDPVRAEQFFRRALDIDPSYLEALFSLFNCLQQQPNRSQEAAAVKARYERTKKEGAELKEILQELEKSPGNTSLMTRAGEMMIKHGNEIFGEHFLYRSLELDRGQVRPHQVLAELYEKRKEPDKAAFHRKIIKQLRDKE